MKAQPPTPALIGPGFAGWSGMFTGLGVGRFAYTPLIPALIEAGWFSAGGAAAQGAANLAGYMVGAAIAFPLASRLPLRLLMRAAMLLIALSCLVCAIRPDQVPFGGLLFGSGRFAAGVAGGVVVALGPPAVLTAMPADRRGRASGIVFAGVGCGTAFAAIGLPWLIDRGLPIAWIGLGVLAATMALAAWPLWPPVAPLRPAPERPPKSLAWLIAGYAFSSFGTVPHMLLLSDFVARGLGAGVAVGAVAFVVFGVGAALGPLVFGALADRIGFRRMLNATMLLMVVAVLAPAALPTMPVAMVSGLVIGALSPGIPPMVLGRAVELGGAEAARRAWASATIAYAIAQASAAWVMAAVFAATGSYALPFTIGGLVGLGAMLLLPQGRERARS